MDDMFKFNGKDYSPMQMLDAMKVPDDMERGHISIGMALSHLAGLADIGDEYIGGCDGLDCLCYHLDIGTVNRAEAALKAIRQRFKEMED